MRHEFQKALTEDFGRSDLGVLRASVWRIERCSYGLSDAQFILLAELMRDVADIIEARAWKVTT